MPRLPNEKVRAILIAHSENKSRTLIAEEIGVDVSTVRATIDRFERTYGTASSVYAVIRPIQKACTHPSLKCLVCGKAHDNIHREELETIERLTNELTELKRFHNLLDETGAV